MENMDVFKEKAADPMPPLRGGCLGRRVVARVRAACVSAWCRAVSGLRYMRRAAASERGQGTTEYAILVGVLVVIAILAITVFKPKLEELWNAISDGIQGL